jgi:hypothetical protein
MTIGAVQPYIVGTATQSTRRAHRGGVNWIFLKFIANTGLHDWDKCSARLLSRGQTCVQLIKELGLTSPNFLSQRGHRNVGRFLR